MFKTFKVFLSVPGCQTCMYKRETRHYFFNVSHSVYAEHHQEESWETNT